MIKIDTIPQPQLAEIIEAYNRGDTYQKIMEAFRSLRIGVQDIAAIRRKFDLKPRNSKLLRESRVKPVAKPKTVKKAIKKAPPKKKVVQKALTKLERASAALTGAPFDVADALARIAAAQPAGMKPGDEVVGLRYDATAGTVEIDVRRVTTLTLKTKF